MNMPLRPVPVTSWPVTEGGHPATLIAALARNAAQSGTRAAFRERDRGVWQEQSWADTFTEVMALAAALEALGLGPGQALTVIGDKRGIGLDQGTPAGNGGVERQEPFGLVRQELARIVVEDGCRPAGALAQFKQFVDLFLVFGDRDAWRAVTRVRRELIGRHVRKDGRWKGAQRHGR